jgi:CRISPR-associated endonuclease/helicase Cas3/CRISPR-associated endonuclease Cas3-HD
MTWTLDSGRGLLSHPAEDGRDEKPLWDHLTGVSERAADLIEGDLSDIERLVGLAHDFPKATPAFQRHVRDEDPDGPKHHARLAALVAYFFLEQNDYSRDVRLAGMLAVAKHHGNVPDTAAYIRRTIKNPNTGGSDSDTTIQAIKQAEEIESHASPFAGHVFREAVGEGAWEAFLDRLGTPSDSPLLGEICEDAGEHRGLKPTVSINPDHFSESFYTTFLVLFGGLTLGDKTDAAGIDDDDDRLNGEKPDISNLESYLSHLGGDEGNEIEENLNSVRGKIQDTIPDQTAAFLDSDKSVGTLTLPTGYGKTLAGLIAGMKISEERGGRIVYALPFTSIIDQTTSTLRDIFGADPTGNLLTVHHHLAETRTVDESSEEEETDENAPHEVLLAESWRTGLTLTTFVQLFESLAGPTNGQSLKLPALQGSTIIIDEPQAIPQHWWPLARRLIEFLTEELDARVLLMTATQPTLVEAKDAFELIPRETLGEIEYSAFSGSRPSRVTYRLHETALATTNEDRLEHETAASILSKAVQNGASVLSICNTIGSTQTLTEEFASAVSQTGTEPLSVAELYTSRLEDAGGVGGFNTTEKDEGLRPSRERARLVRKVTTSAREQQTPAYLHLTTRIRPCDREFLLAVANDLAGSDVPFILISTQLVEAGVDISFDAVFRDFGPLDAIVQAAGRCNRSYERIPETGETTIWNLEPSGDGNIPPSTAVYAPNRERGETDLLMHTRDALEAVRSEHGATISDGVLAREVIRQYHDSVGERVHSVAESNELVTAFKQADGEKLRRASLIDRRNSVELYVCRTESELIRAKAVQGEMNARNFDEVEKIRNELASIRVSIPVPRAETDAASGLVSLEKLTGDDEDPERILESDSSLFDTELGVQLDEYSVEDRFF